MAFYFQHNFLYCDGIRVKEIQSRVAVSPFYLYSGEKIRHNFQAYSQALAGIPSQVSYAIKANNNVHILKILHSLGSWATLVSGNELRLALAAGFEPSQLIFNGNGKTISEISLAIQQGVMVNIDSFFDLDHIQTIAEHINHRARVLLRIAPDLDVAVHPYLSTGLKETKFGIPISQIPRMTSLLSKSNHLDLVGIHCHLGSTIDTIHVFQETMAIMARHFERIKSQGFPLQYINLGGGLGINYHHDDGHHPSPGDLIAAIREEIPAESTLIIEPGRSMIGDTGILVCRVIGVKRNSNRSFIVIDGSMAELIRPSLYQAYHHIVFVEPVTRPEEEFDIVGPVCESADFLGKERWLPSPPEGTGVAIFDTGAYGHSMSSNYNARMKPAEFLVADEGLLQIRRKESIEDYLNLFEPYEDHK